MEPNSQLSNDLFAYIFLGFAWVGLAVLSLLALHIFHKPNAAIFNVEVAASFWLQAILLKTGVKQKAARFIVVAVLLGVIGIELGTGSFFW